MPEPLTYVVYFDFDKAELDAGAEVVLREARAAAEKLGGTVTVAGNTDKSGSDGYNQTLSEMRADAVAKFLAERGVSASVIETSAHGESKPAVLTEDGVRHWGNRRVEIVVQPSK